MIVEIGKEFLETCASLQGLLLERGALREDKITLRFKQTSYAWRQQNGGPELYIVPEFVPFCLLESVLSLQGDGYKIDVDFVT